MKKKSFVLLILAFVYATAAFSQQEGIHKVTGSVTDEKGQALPGVTIVVKGTTIGTVTDTKGKYTFSKVLPNETLVFSFIGMQNKEVNIENQNVINVSLSESTTGLNEVVVVGYGTQKKEDLTGAIVTTKGETIVKNQTPNVINALTGELPGVIVNSRTGEPGRENTSIYVRGLSTTGNNDPLIIIDGVARGSLQYMNPEDIASISVLKDASAAIYGAEAANGVILITTKQGIKGKPTFNFTYDQGESHPTRNDKMADSYTFAEVSNEIQAESGMAPLYTSEELQKYKDGTDPNFANTNWYSYMTKPLTPQNRVGLSVTGGTENTKYFISLGEESQDGQFIQSSLKTKEYTFRSNVDVNVTNWFKVGLNLAGSYKKDHNPIQPTSNLYSHIFLYQPNWTPYWPGTHYMTPNRDGQNILNWVSDNAGTEDWNSEGLESTLSYRLDIPWVKGLYVDGTANYDVDYDINKSFTTPSYVYDKVGTTYVKTLVLSGQSQASLDENFDQTYTTTFNTRINYDRHLGDHYFGIMVGYEQMQSQYQYIDAARTNYISTLLPQIFAGSTNKNNQSNDGNASELVRLSYFGRATYNYAGKYLAEFILRDDGSQNFPRNKRFGLFPGVTLGWKLSEEKFIKKLDLFDNLKIRASYGELGNDQVSPFQYLAAYSYGNNYVIGNNDVTGLVPSSTPNPNITWEVAKTYNLGLDATLWKGLFGMTLNMFKTRRSNILTQPTAVTPDYTGISLPDENIGIVDNKGFELELSHNNMIGELKYSLNGNISFARNKVIYTDETPEAEPYQYATGRPMGSELLYQAIGIFQNQTEIDAYPHLTGTVPGDIKYKDVNHDGVINSLDEIRTNQTSIPEIIYGFKISLGYKNLDMTVFFQGQANAQIDLNSFFDCMTYNLGNFSAWRAENHWSPLNNTNATMPRASLEDWNNNTIASTQWRVNSGFLRLKNMEIGYNLSSTICKKMNLQKVRFYVSGNNLAILFDHMGKMGLDPETTSFWYYPQQCIYNFGVNLTF